MTWWRQWLDAIFDEITFFFFFFFFFSSSPSLRFSSITTLLLLLLTTTHTHTHTCRGNSERAKKMRFSFFFFFFFYSVLSLCGWRRVCLFESVMQLFFLGNDRTTRKGEREREMPWFRLLCLGKQQSIDLLFIIGHYSLSSTSSISLSPFFFFLSTAFICKRAPIRSILVIAPCFTNTSTHVQMKRLMTALPFVFRKKVLTLQWHVLIKKRGEREKIQWKESAYVKRERERDLTNGWISNLSELS